MPAELKDQLAFPYHTSTITQLTKREYFAAMAMQGIISDFASYPVDRSVEVAKLSIKYADELLNQLDE